MRRITIASGPSAGSCTPSTTASAGIRFKTQNPNPKIQIANPKFQISNPKHSGAWDLGFGIWDLLVNRAAWQRRGDDAALDVQRVSRSVAPAPRRHIERGSRLR